MPYDRIISTLGCAELSLPETLALAKRHRLAGLELRALGGTLALPSYLEKHHGSPAALARKLRESGAYVAVLDTSLRLTEGPTGREGFLEFVPWAEELGVRWLRVFDGERGTECAGKHGALDTLRWWRGLRQDRGWRVDLMVETHDSLLDTAQIRDFVAAAPGTKLLWDTHHTWRRGGEDPVATWRAIRSHVVHIHVKDSLARPGERDAFTYVLPGTGEFPMAPLVSMLRREYNGGVSLEWERLWHADLPPLESALDSAAATAWW